MCSWPTFNEMSCASSFSCHPTAPRPPAGLFILLGLIIPSRPEAAAGPGSRKAAAAGRDGQVPAPIRRQRVLLWAVLGEGDVLGDGPRGTGTGPGIRMWGQQHSVQGLTGSL